MSSRHLCWVANSVLRLLTDEHISPAVVEAARRACPEIDIMGIGEWQNGHMLSASDVWLLKEASKGGLTLVSYDLRTLLPLVSRVMLFALLAGDVPWRRSLPAS